MKDSKLKKLNIKKLFYFVLCFIFNSKFTLYKTIFSLKRQQNFFCRQNNRKTLQNICDIKQNENLKQEKQQYK